MVLLRLKAQSFEPKLEEQPTYPLRPVIKNNTCPLRFTAAAGTKFAGA